MPRYESDVCIIGGGISAVLVAQKLSELKPGLSITVVEAGKKLFDAQNRMKYRARSIAYGENPGPGDCPTPGFSSVLSLLFLYF